MVSRAKANDLWSLCSLSLHDVAVGERQAWERHQVVRILRKGWQAMKFSRKVDKPLILYGAGKLGRLAMEVFGGLGIDYNAIDMFDIAEYMDWGDRENVLVAVCVTSTPFCFIKADLDLQRWGFKDIVPVYDIFNAYPECGITNGWGTTVRDPGMLNVFDDVESFVHHTTFWQWRYGHIERSILHFEPRYRIPEICAVTNTTFPEEGSTLADIEARRKVEQIDGHQDYIRIHAEGLELATLKANIDVLQRNRPILAVTCYHTHDGLTKIPKWLMTNLENYRHLFRCHAYMGQAAVMYCIPNERKRR